VVLPSLRLRARQLQQQKKQAEEQAAKEAQAQGTTPGSDTASTGATESQQTDAKAGLKTSGTSFFTLKSKTGGSESSARRATSAELRAQKDISEMYVPPGCKVEFKDPNDIMNFQLSITPSDGLYQGATFLFTINIPNSYPYDAPKAHCDTLVYHPNIDWEGHVCLNILRQDWMPVLSLGSVIFGIMTLFLEPNPDDPLNKEAAALMLDNKKQFENNVRSSLKGGYVLNKHFPKLL